MRRVNSRFSSDKKERIPSNLLGCVVIILSMCMATKGSLRVFNDNRTLQVRSSGAGESPVCCKGKDDDCKHSYDMYCR